MCIHCTCFLDASKAFDRVNHFKLFTTLSKRNAPMYIIRILIFWYTSQTMYVLWNNTMSTGFNVSNGVRQGGILSPYLFCIHVDEISKMLNKVHVGCFVGTMLVNHLMYADDLVLLSPSAAGLSILLSICSTYGIEYDVMYNSTKRNILVFRSRLLKNVHVLEFEINNTAIDRVPIYKYLGHCINDKPDTPQFRGGNPYFFRENPCQSVSFIYASMYSENVHAIHTIPYKFKKNRDIAAKNQNRSVRSHGTTVGLGLGPTLLIDYRSIVIHGGRNLPFF